MILARAIKICEAYFEQPCIVVTSDKSEFTLLSQLETSGHYRGKLSDDISLVTIESSPGWYDEMAIYYYESYNVFDTDMDKSISLCYILSNDVYLMLFDQLNYLLKEF